MDIEFIRTLSVEAGTMALNYFGHTTQTLKPDHSIVTQADVEIEQFLRREISHHYPSHTILGEEGENPSHVDSEFVWALDPIDGTRSFSYGFPIWGISIGLLRDGLPFLGAVYLPYLKELYDTDGVHAFLNREKLPTPHVELNENAGFLVTETLHRRWKIDFLGAIFSLGSVAAHLCYLAKGSAIGLITYGSLWDLAGGAAIVSRLGIEFRYLSGTLLDFKDLYNGQNAREGVIVSSPEHFKALAQTIQLR